MVTELEMKVAALQSQNETLKEGNQEAINAKYIELENRQLEAQKEIITLNEKLEQERNKNRKIVEDFDTMTEVLEEGTAESKAALQQTQQAVVVKMTQQNQKLETKVRDLEHVKKENHELKANREKQQTETKSLFEEKQRLYEDIMALKDQIAQARGDTKEKLLSIQYLETDK